MSSSEILGSENFPLPSLARLADAAPMILWSTDINDSLVYLNCRDLIGPDEWTALKLSDWAKFIHRDDARRVIRGFRDAKRLRAEYQIEYRVPRQDGTIRWMMGSGAPRYAINGEFAGFNGSVIDISSRYALIDHLSEVESQYRALTDNASDLISRYSPGGYFTFVSAAYSKVLGYDEADLLGRSVYEILHPDDIPALKELVVKLRGQGAAVESAIEIRKRHKDGRYFWMSTKLILLSATDRSLEATVAISRDISKERDIKAELERQEQKFRSLTNLSSDWYWETDEQNRFTFVSDGHMRAFGLPPQRVIGTKRAKWASAGDQAGLRDYEEKIARRESFRDVLYSAYGLDKELRHVRVSGEPRFENGAFAGYRGTGRDVTEEVNATKAIARLAEENRALIENSLDALVILDEAGRFIRSNPAAAEITGYTSEELEGRHYWEFLPESEATRVRGIDDELRNALGSIRDLVVSWRKKDGTHTQLSLSAKWSAESRVTYVTGRDVTERQRHHAALQESRDEMERVLESIGDAFYSLDRDWRATYVNERTAKFIGIPKQELLGKSLLDVVPGFEQSDFWPYYARAMESGQPTFFEGFFAPVGAWVDVRLYPHGSGLSVFFADVTASKNAEQAIQRGERRLQNVISMTPAGYLLFDDGGSIVEVNAALCELSGYRQDELVGADVRMLFDAASLSGNRGPRRTSGVEVTMNCRDGRLRHVVVNASSEGREDGIGATTVFVTDITEQKESEARLEQLANHDPLTGLPNRTLVNVRLDDILREASGVRNVAVLFIDLDRFKQVNDSYGHRLGDVLLQSVAERLRGAIRPTDIVARLGGDEFVVAGACSHGTASAEKFASKLLSVLAEPFVLEGHEFFLSASIGISLFPDHGLTKEALFQNADTAMYRAKSGGRDRFSLFEPHMSRQTKNLTTIEHSLRRALERGEFSLRYQPRIDLHSMGTSGSEALLRWNHPSLGMVSPMEFIPIAEDRGYIQSIGAWVLETACRENVRLMQALGRTLSISVNISARQLQSPKFVEQVEDVLRRVGMAPECLELELTESALVNDVELSAAVLKALRGKGIRLSVDDFGTGYSSLSYLRRFPLNILKLDKSFLSQQAAEIDGFAFIRAFVDMAHSLQLSVVAEGVEDESICQFLRECHCDEVQGYLFAQPLTIGEYAEFLRTSTGTPLQYRAH